MRTYHLARNPKSNPCVLPLGTYSMDRFYPTMPFEVFEILVQENKFSICDEAGVEISMARFLDVINHTYTGSSIQVVPLISL